MSEHEQDYFEGEVVPSEPAEAALPATTPSTPPAQQVFNPLDASPQHFAAALQQRQQNYEALREYLGSVLIPYEDFGRIHFEKDCQRSWECTHPGHYTADTLFDPGVDKILSLLGLSVAYPGEDDYRRAALKGIQLTDVIMKAHIIAGNGQLIAEGSGASTTKENQGKLHNTLLKAQKRARMDACRRLPGVSALFEDAMFSTKPGPKPAPGPTRAPSTASAREHRQSTGARLQTIPFGKHKGKRFSELSDEYLQWILDTRADKNPDIWEAAKREMERRTSTDESDPLAGGPDYEPDYFTR